MHQDVIFYIWFYGRPNRNRRQISTRIKLIEVLDTQKWQDRCGHRCVLTPASIDARWVELPSAFRMSHFTNDHIRMRNCVVRRRHQQQTISDYHPLIERFVSELTFPAPPLSHTDRWSLPTSQSTDSPSLMSCTHCAKIIFWLCAILNIEPTHHLLVSALRTCSWAWSTCRMLAFISHIFQPQHQGWARDVNGRDRDETETLASPAETRRLQVSRRDWDVDNDMHVYYGRPM